MKTIILFFVLLFAVWNSFGQHCGFDGASIIIVDIRDENGKVISDLDVALLDSNGTVYTSPVRPYVYPNLKVKRLNDSLKFTQNFSSTSDSDSYSGYFPFADSCYLMLVYPSNYENIRNEGKGDQIRIAFESNSGHESFQFVDLTPLNIQSLCVENEIWRDPAYVDFVKMQIVLKK